MAFADGPSGRGSTSEVKYDGAASAPLSNVPVLAVVPRSGDVSREVRGDAPGADGAACHAAPEKAHAAAVAAGKGDILARYAEDYPKGSHDQPQSMCPAFGSLRVGLRMRRTATILSGSACCVYGLTFTSHFYGARRTVGYVPFNSETLVTGKLFEDIRDAVYKMADPTNPDCDLMQAILYAKENNVSKVFNTLKMAYQNGLKDFSKIENDPTFASYMSMPEMDEIRRLMSK